MKIARKKINAQDAPPAVKRSAWILFCHELTRIDPETHKPVLPRQALSNTLKWMSMQRLSPMQKRILQLLALEGLTYKQVAFRLQRDPNTIKHHCERIRRKIGLDSMYQVIAVAVDLGWIMAPRVGKPIYPKATSGK